MVYLQTPGFLAQFFRKLEWPLLYIHLFITLYSILTTFPVTHEICTEMNGCELHISQFTEHISPPSITTVMITDVGCAYTGTIIDLT